MASEDDPSRLAGWGHQEGYSPYMPLPGMVAHGHFQSNNDPTPVYNFGQLHHSTHKAGPLITSSMQSEMIASNRCGDLVLYVRQILTAIGTPPSGPTLVGSDSSSHEQVVNRLASSNRSKPFLKSYVIQMQRVQAELIAIMKISDANMPSDFLTKWISGRKLRRSLRFATNSDEFVSRHIIP